jgi:hypothetical protein
VGERWTRAARCIIAALASSVPLSVGPGQAHAQVPEWLFPDRELLPDLLAGPRDPAVRGQIVYADPSPTAYGPGWAGEVALAVTVPLLRLSGRSTRDALVAGMEGAAFAHFSFEVVERELVDTDWIFAVPLVWHHGQHWVRLRYYHTSSHLGDEYQRRFGGPGVNFSRDGADLTLYLRPAGPARRLGLGVYAGAMWSVNSHPEETSVWRGRAGLEVDPSGGGPWRPYGALDMEIEDASARGPRWTAQVGIWLPGARGRPLRLALELMTGPAAMGQFARSETRQLALGLLWNP